MLLDTFGRHITYVRLSVTDRCDLRCVYCMAEDMTFLPRSQILTLEEFARLGRIFASLGVTKIRVTGGEPLGRCNVMTLFDEPGRSRRTARPDPDHQRHAPGKLRRAAEGRGRHAHQHQPGLPAARALPPHHPRG